MARVGIEPAWVEDLLGVWAAADVGAVTRRMGHASASPMFRLWGVVDDDVDDDGSYSSAEVAAVRVAVERLAVEQPRLYECLLATFKPWTGIEATAETAAGAVEAGALLATWVDAALGD